LSNAVALMKKERKKERKKDRKKRKGRRKIDINKALLPTRLDLLL